MLRSAYFFVYKKIFIQLKLNHFFPMEKDVLIYNNNIIYRNKDHKEKLKNFRNCIKNNETRQS